MFSFSWYLVGGLIAFGVGVLVGFELADKEHRRSIERLLRMKHETEATNERKNKI